MCMFLNGRLAAYTGQDLPSSVVTHVTHEERAALLAINTVTMGDKRRTQKRPTQKIPFKGINRNLRRDR